MKIVLYKADTRYWKQVEKMEMEVPLFVGQACFVWSCY